MNRRDTDKWDYSLKIKHDVDHFLIASSNEVHPNAGQNEIFNLAAIIHLFDFGC